MKLTVSITTYNQVQFIAQSIENVLMQQTDFDFEILIGEDESNDGTREIVKQYEEKYPDKIRVFYHSYPPDHKRINGRLNFVNNLKNAQGKYIALLEGDDYWTSPHKLQKQVDFLEANPGFAICFTNAYNLFISGEVKDYLRNWKGNDLKNIYTLEDIMFENFIPTASIVFRNHLFKEFPPLFYKAFAGDWILNILNAKHGKIGFIDEITCVRRIHAEGIVSMKSELFKIQANINLINIADELLEYRYHKKAVERLIIFHKRALDILLREKRIEEAKNHIVFCLRHGFSDKSLSRKKLIKTFLQIHFPAFYSVFFRLRAKFS